MRGVRGWRTWLVGGAAVAVLVAAGVATVLGKDGDGRPTAARPRGSEPLTGPELPPPGALSGQLVLSTSDRCRPVVLDLADVELGPPGEPTGCGIWVAQDGSRAVVRAETAPNGRPAELALVELGGRPGVGAVLGSGTGDVAWSSDGERAAWCDATGRTSVATIDGEDGEPTVVAVAGCEPRFADGGVLTLSDELLPRAILRDGVSFIDEEALERALPTVTPRLVSVLGYDVAPDGTIAIVVVGVGRREISQQLVLWRGDRPIRTIELVLAGRGPVADIGDFGFAGKLVRISPTATEVAIGPPRPRSSRLTLLDLRTGLRTLLEPADGIDWSPDGRWIALAAEGGVRVFGADRAEHVFTLPIDADGLAWR